MAIPPGTRIGVYEVIASLGAGGMGEVYRARDHKLQRDVAIKVLPDAFAADPERLARLEREARALAAINHPHIAGIYAVEGRALIMELVEGQDLAERLKAGPLPVDEALAIARQIALALEAAHEAGIIHRDLKPANVKVRADDTVKVLDFGLAKLVQPEGAASDISAANSPTITSLGATQHGIILGTAAYMSPEQARGKAVDRRTDVWAFGCLLYELLTGRVAFAGDNVTDTLAAIVRGEPDWQALPGGTPSSIRRLLKRCLVKDRAHRLADISTAKLEIADAAADDATASVTAAPARPGARLGMFAGGLALGVALAGGAAWALRPAAGTPRPIQLALEMPPGFFASGPSGPGIAMSRDGRRVAQVIEGETGRTQLMVRQLDAPAMVIVPNSQGAFGPFFSPDGSEVGFFSEGRLMRATVGGESAFRIAMVDNRSRGASWSDDGFIYIGGPTGILRVPASGGAIETMAAASEATGDLALRFPSALPNGRGVLFSYYRGSIDNSRLGVLDLQTKAVRELMPQPGSSPHYLLNGQIVFLRSGNLMTVPFDIDRLEVSGTPQPTLSGVSFNSGGAAHFAVSATGALAYVPEPSLPPSRLVWIDRGGKTDPAAIPEDIYFSATLSPSGGQVALVRRVNDGSEIVVWEASTGLSRSLKRAPSTFSTDPIWSADGRDLIFSYRPEGIGSPGVLVRMPADGSRAGQRLLKDEIKAQAGGAAHTPGAVTKDGKTLIFIGNATANDGIHRLNLESSTVERLVDERSSCLTMSPDESHFAHMTRGQVWVRPMADPAGSRWLVSAENSGCPEWSAASHELYFQTGDQLMAARIDSGTKLSDVKPRALFPVPEFSRFVGVAPDAQRFLFLRAKTPQPVLPQIILNWPAAGARVR